MSGDRFGARMLTGLVLLLVGCGGGDGPATEEQAEPASPETGAPAGEREATSLLGGPLHRPLLDPEVRVRREEQLAEARAELEANPESADALIWVGRRLAYLGRYRDAIQTYTQGVASHPDDARLYRHRGHRYITVRELDRAVADFRRAVELIRGQPDQVEPDGQPNARGIPTSTLQSNIWYHLGLAHYLKGDLAEAADAYLEGMKVANNPDMQVAMSHWLYMTHRLRGMEEEAARLLEPIHASMDIIENQAYHELLLLYKGERAPEDLLRPDEAASSSNSATRYGVGNWYLYNGREAEALAVLRSLLEERDQWAGFGFIAAEAELARGRP
jgi:tetratricopeptide (TPR) repeat protein